MSRTTVVGVLVIAMAACGGGKQQAAPAVTHRSVASAPTAHRKATRPVATSARAKQRKRTAAAQKDTSQSRNPLTNH